MSENSSFYTEDKLTVFFRNVSKLLPDCTMSLPEGSILHCLYESILKLFCVWLPSLTFNCVAT